MQPINYTQQVADPFKSAAQGYQLGATIRTDQAQLAEAQAKREATLRMQQDLGALSANPNATGADYAAVMTRYPALSEQLGRSWGALNAAQQQGKLEHGTQAYAALQSGRTDIAEKLFRDRAEAARNSGAEEEAKQAETMADLIKLNPDTARTSIALSLASNMGPDKFAETFGKLGQEQRAADKAPVELDKLKSDAAAAASDAETKRVQAKYADSTAILDLQKKGWDIKKVEADIDIAKQNSRIAAMNAAVAREGNDLKRQELQLKLEEARTARDNKVREKVATAESGASSIDNMLNTIERIKTNPQLDNVVGSLEGRMPGAASLLDDEESDAIALIETLGSQAFLAQIPNIKGMGALSNAEGEKLQSALQNLGRAQSEKQFRSNLDEAARLLKKGRESISRSTGVPLGKPDTPAAPGSRPPLASFER